MNYIEITIWNPFRKGNFSLMPRLEMWETSFDLDWLFISLNVSWYKEPEPYRCDGGNKA